MPWRAGPLALLGGLEAQLVPCRPPLPSAAPRTTEPAFFATLGSYQLSLVPDNSGLMTAWPAHGPQPCSPHSVSKQRSQPCSPAPGHSASSGQPENLPRKESVEGQA
ncbi:uncharacterized protein LOC144366652 [Ictidomys tridecemlineatus]